MTDPIVRPRSGNPGYLIGRPVLSGIMISSNIVSTNTITGSTTTTVKYSIAQDIYGMAMLPKTAGTNKTKHKHTHTHAHLTVGFGSIVD